MTRAYTIDVDLVLENGTTGAQTSSAAFSSIVDTQDGSSTTGTAGAAIVRGVVVADVSAFTVDGASGEAYLLTVEGSDSATFASGIQVLGAMVINTDDAAALAGGSDTTSEVGVYQIPFINELPAAAGSAPKSYRYLRLYVETTGTSPSITVDSAYIAILKR